MDVPSWWRLLVRNRFDVAWTHAHFAAALSAISLINSTLKGMQWLTHGWRVGKVEVRPDPLFVLGHWRSGTTLLHEMLALDTRYAFPSTYACTAPHHFLLTERWFGSALRGLVPRSRPMDNMPFGLDRPQEDELGLCNLGLPSPFSTMAFPARALVDQKYLTLDDLSPAAQRRWQQGWRRFLRDLTFKAGGKPLVLKSPLHTARVRTLLEMFPQARFVHVVRDPYEVFPSTINLWTKLYRLHGLQKTNERRLRLRVFGEFMRLHRAFERDRALIPPGRLVEVRYETLVRQPLAEMRRTYDELELGGFDEVLPALEAFWDSQRGYQTNDYHLDRATLAEIGRRWAPFIEQYGYERAHADGAAAQPVPSRW